MELCAILLAVMGTRESAQYATSDVQVGTEMMAYFVVAHSHFIYLRKRRMVGESGNYSRAVQRRKTQVCATTLAVAISTELAQSVGELV
jgi:hypothetical protein